MRMSLSPACIVFPLLGLLVYAAPFLLGWADSAVAALSGTGFILWAVVRFGLIALLAYQTWVLLRAIGDEGRSERGTAACALVSAAVVVGLFWNATLLTLIIAAIAGGCVLRSTKWDRASDANALSLAVVFGVMLAVNIIFEDVSKTHDTRSAAFRAHTLSAAELAALDADLRERYIEAGGGAAPLRAWGMTDGLTAPATVMPTTFRDRVVDALVIALPHGEGTLRCAKDPEGDLVFLSPPGTGQDTNTIFARLCALRSAEY